LGTLPGLPSSTALDVSSDGSVIVGYATSPQKLQGFFWSLPTGMMVLPAGPDGVDTFAARVSGDGSVIVGSRSMSGNGNSEAVFWSPPNQLTQMGVLAAGFSDSQATAVSGNGKVIVGSGIIGGTTGHSLLWTSETAVQIPQLPGSPSAISHDGQVVFGPGYRWTIGGAMDVIPATENGDDLELSVITATNGDGSLGVGYSGNIGILWDTTHGLRFFNNVVTSDFGLSAPFAGWFDMSVTDVSSDGTIFVGHGSEPTGIGRAWIIDLNAVPEPATWSLLAFGVAVMAFGQFAKKARVRVSAR
jgi:uncharacterized membrane protein